MADLTSKLADSIKKSMSGFGAGIKGSFMSANPAGFGLAMKGIQSAMSRQMTMQTRDFAQRQQDRQFAEEKANEQNKITSDMLGTLHSIDGTLKKILGSLTSGGGGDDSERGAKKAKSLIDPNKKTMGQIAAGVAAASVYKAAKQWANFFKGLIESIKGLINGLKNIFSGEGAIANLFKNIKNLFSEEGALGSLFKKFKNLFAEEGALGSLFKKFKDLFAEEGALGSVFKKFKDLFAEEGALGSVFKKFKDLFAEEGAFGSIIKKFKDLFSEESALGKGIQKLKALFAEEGALGSVIKKFKDLFAEEGVFGKMIKGFSDLFTEEGALGKGIQKLKALFAEEGVFGKMIKGFSELFTETGFFGKAIQNFKNLFSAEGYLGKLFTKIGTLAGDAVSLLKGVGPLAEKFPMLGTFFKGAFAIFGRALKIIPGLNVIFFAIDGLFAAFDTEQIQKDLGVQEVTLKERVAAFFGGGAGGFIGGIIDASLWLVDKIFGTTFAEKSTKEGGDGTYQEKFTTFLTKVVNEFFTWFTTAISVPFNLIKGIFTGNFDDFKKSADDLMLIYQDWAIIVLNAFGELGVGIQNMFGRFTNWVGNKLKSSETIATIYDSVSGAITAIQNSVGKLFYDLGSIVQDAMYSSKMKMAELSEKYLGIKINVDKPADRAPYVEYKAQKFKENYKQTEYVDKKYTPIKNVAGEIRAARQAEKNAAYDVKKAADDKVAAAKNKVDTSSGAFAGGSDSPDYSGQLSNLTSQQTAIAEKIYSGFINAGFSEVQAQAAVVNAYAESRLNPNASNISAKEASFGLFQLNTKGGVGKGYSPEYLKDIDNNIALIIKEAQGSAGEQFRAANTLGGATSAFAQYVERPANAYQTGQNRAAMATNSASVLTQFGKGSQPSIAGTAGNVSSNSIVNSPTDAPLGTAADPVIVAEGATDLTQKVEQDKVDAAIQKQPVLSQAQLDEMKAQQLYREKMDAENKKYQTERDNLEKQFRATLENNIKGQLTAAIPMGATGAAATTNAGGNIANKFLSAPMESLANKLFGKQTGKGVGAIFTQLAGSYGNQLISNVLAPALGMEGGQLNRAFNNFASGNTGMGWSDLMYGMTGIPTDLRSALGYETGIDNFSKGLAQITATPFSPLFNMGSGGASEAEIAATNAGQIGLNAAKQKGQIELLAAGEAGKSLIADVGVAGKNLVSTVNNASPYGSGAASIGSMFGKLLGGGTQTGGGGYIETLNPDTNQWDAVYANQSSGGGDLGFFGNLGNMLTGGKKGAAGSIAAGTNFISTLGGKFIGNKLGLKTDSFGGVLAQTGINTMLKSLMTTGGPGMMESLAGLAPGAMIGSGLVSLGSSSMLLGTGMGSNIAQFGSGMMGSAGTSAGANAMNWISNPTSMISEGSGALAGQLGAVAGAAGAALGGVAISHALSGGYKLDGGLATINDIAVAISSVFGPLGMVISGVIGAAVNRMFGHGAAKLQGMGIQGTVGASTAAGGSGTSLEGYKNMREAGGTYTSDRDTKSTFGIPTDVADALMKDVDANLAAMKKTTTLLGLTSSKSFADFTQSISLDFKDKTAEEQQKMLTDTLATFNNGMLNSVFPMFAAFAEAGEKPIDVMNRFAASTSAFDASWKMLGYSPIFTPGYDPGTGTGMPGDSTFSYGTYNPALNLGTANIDALRAAAIAAKPAVADLYYTTRTVQTNIGATHQEGGGMYSSSRTVADAPLYAEVRDKLITNLNADQLILAQFKEDVAKSFDPTGDSAKGLAIMAQSQQTYFSTYYSPEEQRKIALQLSKEAIDKLAVDTGVADSSGIDETTKIQDKLDAYRLKVEAAKDAMLLDPTNAVKMKAYTDLVANSGVYAQNVKGIISLSKEGKKPTDIAAINAGIQSDLDALAAKEQSRGVGSVLSAEALASGTAFGVDSLGGYTVSPNLTVPLGGTGSSAITAIPISGGTISTGTLAKIAMSSGGDTSGTLFAPSTYVDNSSVSSTNIIGGGGDNVRDVASHPILGSTERSVSSTYGYKGNA
jgi:hypothetical protein